MHPPGCHKYFLGYEAKVPLHQVSELGMQPMWPAERGKEGGITG